jgi:hypothetical protein
MISTKNRWLSGFSAGGVSAHIAKTEPAGQVLASLDRWRERERCAKSESHHRKTNINEKKRLKGNWR